MDINNPKDRDILGNIVRAQWLIWAREQPDVAEHPNWLIPYDDLPERDKEVDRRIGQAIFVFAEGVLSDYQDDEGFPEDY